MSYIFKPGSKILRRPEVRSTTGLSDSSLNRLIASGEFPEAIQLGARAIGWPDWCVYEWLSNRPAAHAEFPGASK